MQKLKASIHSGYGIYNKLYDVFMIDFEIGEILLSSGDTHLLEDVNVIEYTGEKTKEGEEVWEGDIFKQTMGDKEVIFEVIFKYSMFMARIKNGREFALMVALQNNYNHECKLEKLGNVFKNPELLEQKWNQH